MQNFTTPMMKQYQKIKSEYQDCLLFFRLGDFYELFLEDAYIGSQVLNITLTSRPKGKDGRIPMAGVPYHAVDTYLSKLIKAGYKVAICEQVSLPNKYGIVEREVVRVVTPGTVLDEKALEKKENNFIISIEIEGDCYGLSCADLSTGFLTSLEVLNTNLEISLKDELSRLNPVECILSEKVYNSPDILKILKTQKGLNIYCFKEFENFTYEADKLLKEHFKVSTLASFAIEDKILAKKSASALLGYLKHTQKAGVNHIKKIMSHPQDKYLLMDRSTLINLEIFSTIREHDVKGTLLNVLDQTITAMGARLLKSWILKPLTSKDEIEQRHQAISSLLQDSQKREDLQQLLKQIIDIERILSRLSTGLGNARDLISLKQSLKNILDIKTELKDINSFLLQTLEETISPSILEVIKIVDQNITDEPPIDLKIGGLIKDVVNLELDKLKDSIKNSKTFILELEGKERQKTGINSLKVRFNKIFGFYIEISKSNLHLVPDSYLRKQTLVNGERFITPDLKHHEEIILSAEEKIKELEYKLYLQILDKVLKEIDTLQSAAQAIAILDCLLNFAYISEKENYTRPTLLYSGEIKIKGGRHPVVEKLLQDNQFVPNDITLDNISQPMLLITGPNMAGKSVLIRQVALIVLMAQIGCFVPASSAHISIVDRIFVRSGASDVITSNLSTFMVEMVETAHILNYATKNSFIVMDEIGRGTSTYDGISIAYAVAEYLVSEYKTPPKTLFATHYHELQALENQYPQKIKNYHMATQNSNDNPIFLYTLLPGGASHSFGVAVAKLAGIPEPVLKKAKIMLKTLEQRQFQTEGTKISEPTQTEIMSHLFMKELDKIDLSNTTPLEALNKLAEIKDKIKIVSSRNIKVLEEN